MKVGGRGGGGGGVEGRRERWMRWRVGGVGCISDAVVDPPRMNGSGGPVTRGYRDTGIQGYTESWRSCSPTELISEEEKK